MYEVDRDDDASHYSPKTAREADWGPVNRRREHSYNKRQGETALEYVGGTWKREKSPIPEGEATIDGDSRKLGFGGIRGANLCGSAHAQSMICGVFDRGNQCPVAGKKRFIDRIRWKEAGLAADVKTGEVE